MGSYGFVVPNNCAVTSLMVAMALSCQIAVRAYRLRGLWLCRAKAVRTSRGGSYGCFAPKLCGRNETIAKACVPKLCTVERTGQEAEAKIGVFLALRRLWSSN